MKKYVIDTSVWIAYFNPDDSLHIDSLNLLAEPNFKEDLFIFNDLLLEEIFTLLIYKKWIKFAESIFNFMNDNINYKIIEIDIRNIIKSTFVSWKKISITDMSWILLAINYSYELITFDKKQKKLYENMS